MAAAHARGIEVVSVNPASVQGPGRATGTARLLLDYLNGRLKVVVDSTISLVDIADCTEGHLRAEARGKPGERYVLSGATISVLDGLRLLERLTGVERKVRARCRQHFALAAAAAVEAGARLRRKNPPRLPRAGADGAARPCLRRIESRTRARPRATRRSRRPFAGRSTGSWSRASCAAAPSDGLRIVESSLTAHRMRDLILVTAGYLIGSIPWGYVVAEASARCRHPHGRKRKSRRRERLACARVQGRSRRRRSRRRQGLHRRAARPVGRRRAHRSPRGNRRDGRPLASAVHGPPQGREDRRDDGRRCARARPARLSAPPAGSGWSRFSSRATRRSRRCWPPWRCLCSRSPSAPQPWLWLLRRCRSRDPAPPPGEHRPAPVRDRESLRAQPPAERLTRENNKRTRACASWACAAGLSAPGSRRGRLGLNETDSAWG